MRQTGGALLFANDLVHLDPSWINLLLRELLDHRLTEVEQMEQWRRDMKNYCRNSKLHYDEQLNTHRSFLISGRLSKDYLRFLWRDVPGLDEMVFGRMVDALSTYGAMFPCGPNGEETTEFVVPARLPCTVADDTLDKLKEAISGGIRIRFTFRIWGNYVPPGIIAQFVGWFYRDNNIIFRACWSKGASFVMGGREHLICLHEPTDTSPKTRIEITVAGEDQATLWDAALDAKKTLAQLLHHRFKGLQFEVQRQPNTMKGVDAWLDTLDGLQEHLQSWMMKNLEKVLDMMMPASQPPVTSLAESESALLNRIDANLVRRLHELRLDMERDAHQRLQTQFNELRLNVERDAHQRLQTKLDALSSSIGAKIDGSKTDGLGDSATAMLRNVALNVACLRWPAPRLACLLPAHQGVLSENDRSYQSWNARLQGWFQSGKVVRKGMFRRDLRLFLLCAYDMSLVYCGPGGQGYKVKELLDWVKKAKPVAKVGLVLGSIALKVCTGLAVPPEIDSAFGEAFGGVVSKIVQEGVCTVAEEEKSTVESFSDGDDTEQQRELEHARKINPLPVDGFVYEQLADTVRGFERARYKTKKGHPAFHSFSRKMQLVDRGGHGVEWAWVRCGNVEAFVGGT
ncbi:unnamed protein product [Sphacelaria rigidula]